MSWENKFDWIKQRHFDSLLELWSRRSPVGIEIGRNPLSDHIVEVTEGRILPVNGNMYIGPLEGRPLLSELYCGITKAFNLNFHAQFMAANRAYSNGSLHAFSSIVQIALAILGLFGVFVVRVEGRYYVCDVFPWLGIKHEDRKMRKAFGGDWWQYARLISDTQEMIEQKDIFKLLLRSLRVVVVPAWKETVVANLSSLDTKWFNRPRNNIAYNFTGWTNDSDLLVSSNKDCVRAVALAAESIFDWESQVDFGSLPQSLLLAMLLRKVWNQFSDAIFLEIAGTQVDKFPNVGENYLIDEFECAFEAALARAA